MLDGWLRAKNAASGGAFLLCRGQHSSKVAWGRNQGNQGSLVHVGERCLARVVQSDTHAAVADSDAARTETCHNTHTAHSRRALPDLSGVPPVGTSTSDPDVLNKHGDPSLQEKLLLTSLIHIPSGLWRLDESGLHGQRTSATGVTPAFALKMKKVTYVSWYLHYFDHDNNNNKLQIQITAAP